MSKCNKVKNPCKICLGPVTQKTGLQCQGACESWVHYACLNYTPGRIKDIKAGIIKVTCPCPDCKTSLPKEFRTDEPFSCTNMLCPANRPPQCGNVKCPINGGLMNSPIEKMIQTPPCPLGKCGNECKTYANPKPPLAGGPPLSLPCAPGPLPMHIMAGSSASSDSCIDFNKCPSGCSTNAGVAGDARRTQFSSNNFPSLGTMEQMCNTIGLLSNQINDMMTKMRNATAPANGNQKGGGCCPTTHQNCGKSGPKSMCPKPCFCPENPGRKC